MGRQGICCTAMRQIGVCTSSIYREPYRYLAIIVLSASKGCLPVASQSARGNKFSEKLNRTASGCNPRTMNSGVTPQQTGMRIEHPHVVGRGRSRAASWRKRSSRSIIRSVCFQPAPAKMLNPTCVWWCRIFADGLNSIRQSRTLLRLCDPRCLVFSQNVVGNFVDCFETLLLRLE